MIIAFTGHTDIEKACGYPIKEDGKIYDKQSFDIVYSNIYSGLIEFCENQKINFNDLTLVSGMARGVDEVVAFIAMNHSLKLIACIPASIAWHKNRPPSRGIRSQAIWYDHILGYNRLEVIEVPKGNFPFVNFARNFKMVEIADKVVSYKRYDSTGTDHCIKEAKKQNKYLGNTKERYDK